MFEHYNNISTDRQMYLFIHDTYTCSPCTHKEIFRQLRYRRTVYMCIQLYSTSTSKRDIVTEKTTTTKHK